MAYKGRKAASQLEFLQRYDEKPKAMNCLKDEHPHFIFEPTFPDSNLVLNACSNIVLT